MCEPAAFYVRSCDHLDVVTDDPNGRLPFLPGNNIAACGRGGVVPDILHKINVTPRSRGFGAAWGISVRDQLGAVPRLHG